VLSWVRGFFESRGVLEVETPVLCHAGAVDEHLDPIPVEYHPHGDPSKPEKLYLVTSPEHSMKRLLASGSGPIYQITRAFRDGERGPLHNPEFSILEWYRTGWDHRALMDEVEDLIRGAFTERARAPGGLAEEASMPFERVTYKEAFLRAVGVDPFRASDAELAALALAKGCVVPGGDCAVPEGGRVAPEVGCGAPRDALLNVLLAATVEKTLGLGRPAFLLDYPPSQAALARVRPGDPPVAERFELYVRGVELANGYHELLDSREQSLRFVEANEKRKASGKEELPLDQRFLRALEAGMPSCAGVAVGLDRVVLLALGASRIDDVIAFPVERA
jgi:lysyl-tRNA synthetase class 2